MRKSLFLIVFIFPLLAYSGGWPKKKGSGYYKIGYSLINGKHFYDNSGSKIPLERPLHFNTLSVYGEYGVSNRLTAIAYVPFATTAKLESANGVPDASITTVGDINLGFRYGLIRDQPNVLSFSGTVGIPTGRTSDDTSGGAESLQTGDGEFNQLIKLESGHSLNGGFYASSYLGINFRSKGFSEEVRFGGEIGHVGESLISIIKFQSITSLKNGENTANANADFFNNNMEIRSVAPEFAIKLSDSFGLTVNHTIYLSGRKTLASPNTTIGFFWDI